MAQLPPLSLEQCVTLACLWEVSVPKLGNVHRGADFADTTLYDFVTSVPLIASPLAKAKSMGVGASVLEAVSLSRAATDGNTHLGTVLLLAPLCAVPPEMSLKNGIEAVLQSLTVADSSAVYEAIRRAAPGGLGQRDRWDVSGSEPDDLIAAMALASDSDRVARQYSTNFQDVLQQVAPLLRQAISQWGLVRGILRTQLQLMSQWPDSLIARKCGAATVVESANRAQEVLDSWDREPTQFDSCMADFDFWLRSDGNRRNPGTTADLIAAGLFCELRDGDLVRFSYEEGVLP
ncbi:MAG: triphosphoribosyl-dephospho-CoA synthase [Planctomycetota bacterium]|nr:triphosphoribosyl-dephospho-CoA synthase [Planctomycetota bacterium]